MNIISEILSSSITRLPTFLIYNKTFHLHHQVTKQLASLPSYIYSSSSSSSLTPSCCYFSFSSSKSMASVPLKTSSPFQAEPLVLSRLDSHQNGHNTIIISGPSGTGKSTILNRLLAKYPDKFAFSVSHTSRKAREGEQDGVAYHFITRDRFCEMVAENGFIEHTEFSGNYYGTSYAAVDSVISGDDHESNIGRVCLLDIEMEGVKQFKASKRRAKYLFLAPPDFMELERRLRGRGTDGEEALQRRLAKARVEMDFSTQGAYDCIVVNRGLDEAFDEVEKFCLQAIQGSTI